MTQKQVAKISRSRLTQGWIVRGSILLRTRLRKLLWEVGKPHYLGSRLQADMESHHLDLRGVVQSRLWRRWNSTTCQRSTLSIINLRQTRSPNNHACWVPLQDLNLHYQPTCLAKCTPIPASRSLEEEEVVVEVRLTLKVQSLGNWLQLFTLTIEEMRVTTAPAAVAAMERLWGEILDSIGSR